VTNTRTNFYPYSSFLFQDSGSSPDDEEINDYFSSGLEPSLQADASYEDNKHPTHPLTEPSFSTGATKIDSKLTNHRIPGTIFPTVKPVQKPDKGTNLGLSTRLPVDATLKISHKDNKLLTPPPLNLSPPVVDSHEEENKQSTHSLHLSQPSRVNISKADSKSKYGHSRSGYGSGSEDHQYTKKSSRMEFAHCKERT
jgi:hypothetical protein